MKKSEWIEEILEGYTQEFGGKKEKGETLQLNFNFKNTERNKIRGITGYVTGDASYSINNWINN